MLVPCGKVKADIFDILQKSKYGDAWRIKCRVIAKGGVGITLDSVLSKLPTPFPSQSIAEILNLPESKTLRENLIICEERWGWYTSSTPPTWKWVNLDPEKWRIHVISTPSSVPSSEEIVLFTALRRFGKAGVYRNYKVLGSIGDVEVWRYKDEIRTDEQHLAEDEQLRAEAERQHKDKAKQARLEEDRKRKELDYKRSKNITSIDDNAQEKRFIFEIVFHYSAKDLLKDRNIASISPESRRNIFDLYKIKAPMDIINCKVKEEDQAVIGCQMVILIIRAEQKTVDYGFVLARLSKPVGFIISEKASPGTAAADFGVDVTRFVFPKDLKEEAEIKALVVICEEVDIAGFQDPERQKIRQIDSRIE